MRKKIKENIFYDFRDLDGIKKFQILSSKSTLRDVFLSNWPLHLKGSFWWKELNHIVDQSFKKIQKKKISQISPKRSYEKIFELESTSDRNYILSTFHYFNRNPEEIVLDKMWRLLNKIWG